MHHGFPYSFFMRLTSRRRVLLRKVEQFLHLSPEYSNKYWAIDMPNHAAISVLISNKGTWPAGAQTPTFLHHVATNATLLSTKYIKVEICTGKHAS